MEVRAIRTDADYCAALREVSALIDLDPDRESPQGKRLEVIGALVQAYEAEHYPIDHLAFCGHPKKGKKSWHD